MGLCCSSSAKDADLKLGENIVSLEEGNGTDEMLMPSNSSGWFSIRREYWFLTAVVVVILIFAIAGEKLPSSVRWRLGQSRIEHLMLSNDERMTHELEEVLSHFKFAELRRDICLHDMDAEKVVESIIRLDKISTNTKNFQTV
eukprot:546025_1